MERDLQTLIPTTFAPLRSVLHRRLQKQSTRWTYPPTLQRSTIPPTFERRDDTRLVDGTRDALIFSKIEEAMQLRRPSPRDEPLITVTKVMKGVQDVLQGSEPEGCLDANVSQWVDGHTGPGADTPAGGVTIVCAMAKTGAVTVIESGRSPRNLLEKFEKERGMEAVKQLFDLFQGGPVDHAGSKTGELAAPEPNCSTDYAINDTLVPNSRTLDQVMTIYRLRNP